uniref:Programmed cell death protein 10 n=1 Tax=Panagrolaimus sp. ES5 TaxID=591445 RepID=A0AC34F4S0_9BILA
MSEEGGYLGAMTYQAIYSSAFEKLKTSHSDNPEATSALNLLQRNLLQADNSSSSFLFDFAKTLLTDAKLNVNLQESYLRMHATAPVDDLEMPQYTNRPEFQELSLRAIALRRVLARVPDEMKERRPFLETIKEIASSIKKLLDATNVILQIIPPQSQPIVEKRKREFVHYSKRFSNTLKEYFRDQNQTQVFVAANQLIFQTTQIVRTVRDRIRVQ